MILDVEIDWVIWSVRIQLWLESFRMNTFGLLPLQDSMAQSGAIEHDRWRGYMTSLVVNLRIIESISILSMVTCRMIIFDVDKPRHFFRQEPMWTLPFVSSFRLSLRWIWTAYTTFHMRCYRKQILIVWQKWFNQFPMLCVRSKAVEIIMLCYVAPCWSNKMGCKLINLCWNLVAVWACIILSGTILQHTSFKISLVRTSNAMDQMLVCFIVVFQSFHIICQCRASANAFATCRIA